VAPVRVEGEEKGGGKWRWRGSGGGGALFGSWSARSNLGGGAAAENRFILEHPPCFNAIPHQDSSRSCEVVLW
jgi:hypothetical protein